ncbi:MAG: winged helix-turn-helix transcriptional regulator [Syntrophales bacterium]|nr:winged helix-turn-helix transcriptional regulator [Syntrophales bacterium]
MLDKARRLIRAMTPKHPWLPLSDEELLHKAGFWRNDPLTGREGYTLAAGLMFGKEEVIQQLVPHYKIDALVRRENLDRYDDRLNIRVNLIEAYDLLMDFVAKHLSDPFYLDGIQRISLRDKIFREIVANLLVHREYTDARPATLIVYRDRVETTNAAHPHGQGPIAPEHFAPYSKNPTLSKFFMQMGRGEELGSGVLNVSKYLPLYAKGAKPQFVEGNPFIAVIPLPAETGVKISGKGEEKSREKSREKILKMIRQKPTVTTQEMMDSLGLSRAGIEKIVKKLQQERRISRVGPDKGGHWEVVKDQQP